MNSLFGKIRHSAAHFVANAIHKVNPLFGKVREGVSTALRKVSNTGGDVARILDGDVAKSVAKATGLDTLRNDVQLAAQGVQRGAGNLRSDLEANVPKHLTVPSKRLINFE